MGRTRWVAENRMAAPLRRQPSMLVMNVLSVTVTGTETHKSSAA